MRSTWKAHAKVNLSLDVGAVRADGYHPYVSYATSVGIADTLTFTRADDGRGVRVMTSTGLVDSLVTSAVEAVLAAAGTDVGVEVEVVKRIPTGAGLGGGSADAACALVATASLLGRADLDPMPLAAAIGTDVPFCLAGGCARLTGRGELVEGLPSLPPFGVLVVVPPLHVPTAAVFAAFDRVGPGESEKVTHVPDWLAALLPECSFRNDLEAAASVVVPELVWWRDAIGSVAGRAPLMTGSGAGYVLFDRTPDDLRPLAAQVAELGASVWVTTPVDSGVVEGGDVGT